MAPPVAQGCTPETVVLAFIYNICNMISAASLLIVMAIWTQAFGFTIPSLTTRPVSIPKTALQMNYGREVPRKNIRIPLLIDRMSNTPEQRQWNVPLPNAHLPVELTTASLYELKVDAPIHKMVISQAVSSYDTKSEGGCCYGHIVWKGHDDLVGAIGCAGEILIGAAVDTASISGDEVSNEVETLRNVDPEEDTGPLMVLARGAYRFCVREVVSTIPHPVAIVDELLDEDDPSKSNESNNLDDEEEEDFDVYTELTAKDLIKGTLESLDKVLKLQYDESSKPLTPLEQSILESADSPEPMAQAISRTFDAEERIAVYQTFVSSLLDIAPDERDRCYAVAMMAGELANFSSELRVKLLTTTDGARRLRMVLRELTSILSLDSVKRMTKSISLGVTETKEEDPLDTSDYDGIVYNDFEEVESEQFASTPPPTTTIEEAEDALKELKVGIPKLPAWADQIQNGCRVEYFWSEEEGWCIGTVVGDPIRMGDEVLIDVKFDDDGSVHRLPLRGEDKARWRPP